MTRWLAVVALVAFGACGGNHGRSTTAKDANDPYAVPATIDAAYVAKVVGALARDRTAGAPVTVDQLITAHPECIYAAVRYPAPASPAATYVSLRRLQPGADPSHLNPTPWTIVLEDAGTQGSPPANPCDA